MTIDRRSFLRFLGVAPVAVPAAIAAAPPTRRFVTKVTIDTAPLQAILADFRRQALAFFTPPHAGVGWSGVGRLADAEFDSLWSEPLGCPCVAHRLTSDLQGARLGDGGDLRVPDIREGAALDQLDDAIERAATGSATPIGWQHRDDGIEQDEEHRLAGDTVTQIGGVEPLAFGQGVGRLAHHQSPSVVGSPMVTEPLAGASPAGGEVHNSKAGDA
jgi:hypothetical protein